MFDNRTLSERFRGRLRGSNAAPPQPASDFEDDGFGLPYPEGEEPESGGTSTEPTEANADDASSGNLDPEGEVDSSPEGTDDPDPEDEDDPSGSEGTDDPDPEDEDDPSGSEGRDESDSNDPEDDSDSEDEEDSGPDNEGDKDPPAQKKPAKPARRTAPSMAEETFDKVVYGVRNKRGKVVNAIVPSHLNSDLQEAILECFDGYNVELSDEIQQRVIDGIIKVLGDEGLMDLTSCVFTDQARLVGESDPETKRAKLAAYFRQKQRDEQDSTLERELESALQELAERSPERFDDLAALTRVKPAKGKSLTAKDFLRELSAQKDRELLLNLIQQELARLSDSD